MELGPPPTNCTRRSAVTRRRRAWCGCWRSDPNPDSPSDAFGAGGAWFEHIDDLIAEARRSLTADVAVLVKGSRANRLERVTAALARGQGEAA